MRILPLLLLPLALAACDGKGGTTISINATSDDGENATVSVSNGIATVKADNFGGHIKMPAIKMTAENFDMDGVKLYPNSTITSFNIDATDHKDAKDEGKVVAGFTSPAALAKVQDWFRGKLTDKGFKFTARGDGFAGTTDDGQSFTLDLSADGGDKTKGRMEIVGS